MLAPQTPQNPRHPYHHYNFVTSSKFNESEDVKI
jgi:hypothetical protein